MTFCFCCCYCYLNLKKRKKTEEGQVFSQTTSLEGTEIFNQMKTVEKGTPDGLKTMKVP